MYHQKLLLPLLKAVVPLVILEALFPVFSDDSCMISSFKRKSKGGIPGSKPPRSPEWHTSLHSRRHAENLTCSAILDDIMKLSHKIQPRLSFFTKCLWNYDKYKWKITCRACVGCMRCTEFHKRPYIQQGTALNHRLITILREYCTDEKRSAPREKLWLPMQASTTRPVLQIWAVPAACMPGGSP